jgi:hypothetical protein
MKIEASKGYLSGNEIETGRVHDLYLWDTTLVLFLELILTQMH